MIRKLVTLLVFLLPLAGFSQKLIIRHLVDSVYVFTTFGEHDGEPFPANGAYITTPSGAVMIDTPWDTTQFQPLLDSIMARHQLPVRFVISTHFHADRTAGLDYYKRQGIATWSHRRTQNLCKAKGEPVSEFSFLSDTTFLEGGIAFQADYEGEGHSPDNIVVWMPQFRVLYGGCLIKSLDNDGIGNLSDANVPEWELTMQRLIRKYKAAKHVVPGHLSLGGRKTLKHTLRIVKHHLR
jgi:glyoxylase-like metal-dependent hydrolase (beta-lactamase superfamily II)